MFPMLEERWEDGAHFGGRWMSYSVGGEGLENGAREVGLNC